jgi:hypothetical protein
VDKEIKDHTQRELQKLLDQFKEWDASTRKEAETNIRPRSKGYGLDGNFALVCCRCNTDKGSLSLGQWLTRLSRAGDARAGHVRRSLSVIRPLKSPVTRSHRKMQMPA